MTTMTILVIIPHHHDQAQVSTDSGAVPIVATTGRPGLSDYIIASPTIEEFVAFRCAFVMIIVNTRSLPAIEEFIALRVF